MPASTAPVAVPDARTQRRVFIPALAWPGAVPAADWRLHRLEGAAMGTGWRVSAYAPAALGSEWLRACVQQEIAHTIACFSHWDAHSEVARFNRAAPGQTIAFSAEAFAVLQSSLTLAEQSQGAIDPTLGALANVWGFGPAGPRPLAEGVPTAAELAQALGCSGWRKLRLLPAPSAPRSLVQPGGLQLDLSGIAKGWCVDRVSERLSREGASAHLVDIGGELKAAGLKPGLQPWWVALESPADADAPQNASHAPPDLVALCDGALATSGDYRRYFLHGGRRYAHTLDGATGQPVQGVACVSVLHASAMQADAWATALTVLAGRNPAQAMAWAEQHQLAVRLVLRHHDGCLQEHLTPALRAMLDL